MAEGAAYPAISKDSSWYYLRSAALPTLPADLAAADAIAVAANLFIHTTGDPQIPGVSGGADEPEPMTWREHGADAVRFTDDITPAPRAADRGFELPWVADLANDLHRAILTAAAGTYAVLICDVQTSDGDGTRGGAAGNAEGTLFCLTVRHDDAPVTIPSGATPVQATTSFRVVKDAADAPGRKVIHYGEA